MELRMRAGLRFTFLAHAIVSIVIGLQHLLAPRLWTDFIGLEVIETVTWRLIGAALIGLGVGSAMAVVRRNVAPARILVVVNATSGALGTLVLAWGVLSGVFPMRELIAVVIFAVFTAAFVVFGFRQPTAPPPMT